MKNLEFVNNIKNESINFKNSVNGNSEIEISGEIGQSFFSDGYTFDKFKNDLNQINGKIIINIKSMGGNLFEALAIYDHIRSLKNKVVTKIVGSSASAATLISLAGDTRYITQNSRYLIHKPMIAAMGNSDDFKRVIEQLEDLDRQVVNLYVQRTKLTEEEVVNLMKEEKFISSEEAITMGFVDDYVKDKDYVKPEEIENNDKNIKTEDMNAEILKMLGVENDAEAKEKIENMLTQISEFTNKIDNTTQEATTEVENNVETEIEATQESASEDVNDVINEVNDENDAEEEKEEDEAEDVKEDEDAENEKDDEKEADAEEEEKEDAEAEEDVEKLKAKIKSLEKALKEKEEEEAKNAMSDFMNVLEDASQKGKISKTSFNDWVNVYNREGADFTKNLLNNIPEKINVVDSVVNEISEKKYSTKDEILNDWKNGKISGELVDTLLKQIK